MKKLLSAALAVCLIFSLSACKKDAGGKVITYETEVLPNTFDPLICSNQTELLVVYNIFEPLVVLNEDGTLSPGAAESYNISSDGLKISFALREDACWSDGQKVEGQDFVFGLRRAVDPVTEFSGASALFNIINAPQILNGEASADTLGVSCRDNTLEISLSSPDDDIIYCFAGPAGMPCREDAFDASGGKYCMTKDTTLSNGPFALSKWIKSQGEEAVKFIKNDYYVGLRQAVSQGVYCPIEKSDGRLDRLKNENIDCGTVSSDLLSSAEDNKNQMLGSYSATAVMAFSFAENSPFADDIIRRGLYATVDRNGISAALPEYYEVADDLLPPSSICSEGIWRENNPPKIQLTDRTELDELILSAKDRLSENKVTSVTVAYQSETDKAVVNYTAQSWQKNFGLKVELVCSTRSAIIAGIKNGTYAAGIFTLPFEGKMASSMLLNLSSKGLDLGDSTYNDALSLTEDSCEKLIAAENILFEKSLLCPMYYEKKYYIFSENVTDIKLSAMSGTVDFTSAGLI